MSREDYNKIARGDCKRCGLEHGVDLSGSDLELAKLNGAKLDHTNLRGANLSNVNIIGASIAEADLRDTKLGSMNIDDGQGHIYRIEQISREGDDPE